MMYVTVSQICPHYVVLAQSDGILMGEGAPLDRCPRRRRRSEEQSVAPAAEEVLAGQSATWECAGGANRSARRCSWARRDVRHSARRHRRRRLIEMLEVSGQIGRAHDR